MRIDALQRLIEAAGPSELRDLARICLQARGFSPVVTEGPYEGAADIVLYQHPIVSAPYPVALSSARDWEKKLMRDAARARERLPAATHFLFVSSQRIPPGGRLTRILDELQRDLGLEVACMDSQMMASIAEEYRLTADVLRIFGIRVGEVEPRRALRRGDLRRDLACACAFFGTQAEAFRDAVVENAVLAAVSAAGGVMRRVDIVAQARLALGLSATQEQQARSAVDRLLGRGLLVGRNGHLTIEAATASAWATTRALREHSFAQLKAMVRSVLIEHLRDEADAEPAVDALLEDLGALLLDGASATSAALSHGDAADKDAVLRDRLRHLQATLESVGLGPSVRDRVMSTLVERASASTFGRALLSGEVFLQLTRLGTGDLFRAIGADGAAYVVLDTSVAMPMLCALLYEPTEQEIFFAARSLHEQLAAHRIEPLLPRPYIEEIASHLVAAAQTYGPIADLDPDLRASRNVFVAHHAALPEQGKRRFEDYLDGFGFRPALARTDFFLARDLVMRELAAIAGDYGLRVVETPARKPQLELARWGVDLAMGARRAQRPHHAERARKAREHDTEVLGWLLDPQGLGAPPGTKLLLCSWDKLFQAVRTSLGGAFDVLSPLALCDALSLASADDVEAPPLVSPLAVARELSDEAALQGAEVWDQLAEIEKGRLHDAELRNQARAFKDAWVSRTGRSRRTMTLQEAWAEWKREHLGVSSA